MAPPTKRRRLVFWNQEDEADSSTRQHGFAHTVDPIDASAPPTQLVELMDTPGLLAQYKKELEIRQVDSVVVVVQADIIVSTDSTIPSSSSAAVVSSSAAPQSTPTPAGSILSSTSVLTPAASSTASVPIAVSTSTGTSATSNAGSLSSSLPIDTSSITSSTPAITSGIVPSAVSKNLTVAADILTSNLTFSSSSSISRVSSLFPSAYSNHSISLNSTTSSFASSTLSTDSFSSTGSTTSDAGVVIVTTTGTDGRPSTYTTHVGAPYGTTTAPSSSDPTYVSNSNGTPTPPPPGTIAGGVVGGAAGLAVLLLVAMLFLRWYRQKAQRERQALLPASFSDNDLVGPKSGPGMAESAGIRPLMSAVPALFRHEPSKSLAVQRGLGVNNERGFQRLSGRKLPSAFSPGMEYGQPPPMPVHENYRDNNPFPYPPSAGPGPLPTRDDSSSPADSSTLSRQTTDERMTMLPGPQRRPTIHNTHGLQVPGTSSHTRHVSSSARTSGVLS